MISNRPALELHHTENEAAAFPLSVSRASIGDLYCLFMSAAVLIKDTQRTEEPPGGTTLHDLIATTVFLLEEGRFL